MPDNVFRDFELHIRRSLPDGLYPVTARVPSEDRWCESDLRLPFDENAVSQTLSWIEEGLVDADTFKNFGGQLFQALFKGPVKDLYASSRLSGQAPLRYRLIIDAPAVARVPWELLYDPERRIFLANETSLVRGIGLTEPTRPIQAQPPLRILVVAPFPLGLPQVQGQDELDAILHELSDRSRRKDAEVKPLLHASRSSLQNELREAAANQRAFHVLHFIGHGQHDPGTGETVLLFEDEEGRPDLVTPEALVNLLRPYDLKLVFLNACQTVQSSAFDVAQGFAPALMSSGVPAVIGMQVSVLDRLALQFARNFYAALADNQPVDQALLSTRQLVQVAQRQQRADIAIPVCYLRTASGQIVDLVKQRPARLTRGTWREWLRQRAAPQRIGFGLAGLLGIVGMLLALIVIVRPPQQPPLPTPVPAMSGDFNIAVAPFSAIDSQGRTEDSPAGLDLANELFQSIQAEVNGLPEGGPKIEVKAPALVSPVLGNNADEQAQNAVALVRELGADLLLYGTLESGSDFSELTPRLYVASDRLRNAEELAGPYGFGDSLRAEDNIEHNPIASQDLRDQLSQRTVTLTQFITGLGYFLYNQVEDAGVYFESARQSSAADPKMLRVIDLFLGSTAARQGDLQAAGMYYTQALRDDPKYARAQLGQAQVRFLQARDGCERDKVDAAGLSAAIEGYEKAKEMPSEPLEEIPTKAALFLANAYYCQSRAEVADHWGEAQEYYQQVIDHNTNDSSGRTKYLAAYAQRMMGVLYSTMSKDGPSHDDLARAEKAFSEAVALEKQLDVLSIDHMWLAWIHGTRQECTLAAEELDRADTAKQAYKAKNPHLSNKETEDFRQGLAAELAIQCPGIRS